MSASVAYEKVRDNLARLKLDAALTELDDILERGQKEERLPVEVLADLTERELSHRSERRVQTNFRLSGLPVLKRIEEFDFEA